MKIREYKDGLAFITDDTKYEIAFYSNITDRITYCEHNGYKDWIAIGCVELPFEDNLNIIEEVRRYKNMRDICIDYCESTICDGCKYKDASDEERDIVFVLEDIIRCKDEPSKHNRSGEYGFDIDGKHLKIKFEWT